MGDWLKDRTEGSGKYTDLEGNKYSNCKQGRFYNGRLQGKGKCLFSNGDKYKGMFVDGKFNGLGKMIYKHINVPDFFEQEAEYVG